MAAFLFNFTHRQRGNENNSGVDEPASEQASESFSHDLEPLKRLKPTNFFCAISSVLEIKEDCLACQFALVSPMQLAPSQSNFHSKEPNSEKRLRSRLRG
jgi:hypothetical protein